MNIERRPLYQIPPTEFLENANRGYCQACPEGDSLPYNVLAYLVAFVMETQFPVREKCTREYRRCITEESVRFARNIYGDDVGDALLEKVDEVMVGTEAPLANKLAKVLSGEIFLGDTPRETLGGMNALFVQCTFSKSESLPVISKLLGWYTKNIDHDFRKATEIVLLNLGYKMEPCTGT